MSESGRKNNDTSNIKMHYFHERNESYHSSGRCWYKVASAYLYSAKGTHTVSRQNNSKHHCRPVEGSRHQRFHFYYWLSRRQDQRLRAGKISRTQHAFCKSERAADR